MRTFLHVSGHQIFQDHGHPPALDFPTDGRKLYSSWTCTSAVLAFLPSSVGPLIFCPPPLPSALQASFLENQGGEELLIVLKRVSVLKQQRLCTGTAAHAALADEWA